MIGVVGWVINGWFYRCGAGEIHSVALGFGQRVLCIVTNPFIVAIFKHMVTPVGPTVEVLPVQNRLFAFNLHHNAGFYRTSYFSEILYY